MISRKMIKLYEKSIAPHLKLIVQSILENGMFPDNCLKKTVTVKIRHQISLKKQGLINFFPIFSNIFETLTFNSSYNYFSHKNLFTEIKSGFILGDSQVAQ